MQWNLALKLKSCEIPFSVPCQQCNLKNTVSFYSYIWYKYITVKPLVLGKIDTLEPLEDFVVIGPTRVLAFEFAASHSQPHLRMLSIARKKLSHSSSCISSSIWQRCIISRNYAKFDSIGSSRSGRQRPQSASNSSQSSSTFILLPFSATFQGHVSFADRSMPFPPFHS